MFSSPVTISTLEISGERLWIGKKEDEVECEVRVTVSEPVTNKKYCLLEYQAVFKTSESPLSTFKVIRTISTRQLLNSAALF